MLHTPPRRIGISSPDSLRRIALLATALWFSGCDSAVIVRKYHDSGQLMEEQACLKTKGNRVDGDRLVPHGLHVIWDAKGNRRRIEMFNRGKRVGYVLTWDEDGNLRRDGQIVGLRRFPSEPSGWAANFPSDP